MVFGAWMNNENETDYKSDGTFVTKKEAAEHTQWKLISASAYKKSITLKFKDGSYSTSFPNLIYSFVIERHSSLTTTCIGGTLHV